MTQLDGAIIFAAMAHAGQRRKYDGLPYLVHLIETLEILVETVPDADENMQIAAVLHDTVEDTDTTMAEIEKAFGPDVAALVYDLTERPAKGNRALRKAAECKRLSKVSARAQTIKLADLISNTRDIVAHDAGFAKVYLPEKAKLLAALTQADPEMQTRAMRVLTRSLSRLSLSELQEECDADGNG